LINIISEDAWVKASSMVDEDFPAFTAPRKELGTVRAGNILFGTTRSDFGTFF
jgi:hypothetical protein